MQCSMLLLQCLTIMFLGRKWYKYKICFLSSSFHESFNAVLSLKLVYLVVQLAKGKGFMNNFPLLLASNIFREFACSFMCEQLNIRNVTYLVVTKMLSVLRKDWAPLVFSISFKVLMIFRKIKRINFFYFL